MNEIAVCVGDAMSMDDLSVLAGDAAGSRGCYFSLKIIKLIFSNLRKLEKQSNCSLLFHLFYRESLARSESHCAICLG